MDEIHVHKTKKSICAHFAESPCNTMSSNTSLKSKHLILLMPASIPCLKITMVIYLLVVSFSG